MSPSGVTFRQQIDSLVDELSDCIGFCNLIRENRRLGSKHENFDNLVNYLHESTTAVSIRYQTLQECFGSRMDAGDEASIIPMSRCLRAVTCDIKKKLYEIAHKRTHHNGIQLPGFKDLLKHWKVIEEDTTNIIINLSRRLVVVQVAPTPSPAPAPTSILTTKPEPKIGKDQMIVSNNEFNFLVDHMKNSWTERWSNDRLVYINHFDGKLRSYEKPDAFIKAAPTGYRPARQDSVLQFEEENLERPARRDDYERGSQRRRDDYGRGATAW